MNVKKLTYFFVALLIFTGTVSAKDIGLKEAEELAIENSDELKALRAEKEINGESVKAKLRDFFPSVSFSYRHSRNVAERELDNGNYSVQMSVSQPIYDSGRKNLAYEISRINFKLADAKYRTAKNQLQFQIRKAYLDIQKKRENLSLIAAGLENAESLLKKSEVEHKLGIITEIDYREIKNEYEKRLLSLEQNRAELNDTLTDFYYLLDSQETGEHPTLRHLNLYDAKFNEITITEEELIQIAMQNRIDLKESQLTVARQAKEYMIAEYSALPVISLTGHYGKSGERWPPESIEWGVGFNFSMSLFGNSVNNDFNYNSSRSDTTRGYTNGGSLNIYDDPLWKQTRLQKTLDLNRAKQKKEELIFNVSNKISRIRRNLTERKRSLDLADEIAAIQERRHEIEKYRYSVGEISLHDYFQEELRLNENRLKLIQERVDYILNVNQLELEIGLELDQLQLTEVKEYLPEESKEFLPPPGWTPKTVITGPANMQR